MVKNIENNNFSRHRTPQRSRSPCSSIVGLRPLLDGLEVLAEECPAAALEGQAPRPPVEARPELKDILVDVRCLQRARRPARWAPSAARHCSCCLGSSNERRQLLLLLAELAIQGHPLAMQLDDLLRSILVALAHFGDRLVLLLDLVH